MHPTETLSITMDVSSILHVPGLPQEDPDNVQRYSGERLRYRSRFISKWKNPTNRDNMSVHENFRDGVKLRATMAFLGQGYACIPPQERTRQRPIECLPSLELYPWNTGPAPVALVCYLLSCHSHCISTSHVACCTSLAQSSPPKQIRGTQRHGGIRNTRKIVNSGVATKRMTRSALVGEMVHTVALSPHFFCKSLAHSQFFFQEKDFTHRH